jgi:hypothetical protein
MRLFQYQIDDDFGFGSVIIKGARKYYVEGYASTIDQDKAGEIISISAQEDIYNQLVGESITLDLEHELWYDDSGQIMPRPSNDKIPIAKVVDARIDSRGVWIKAELNQNLSKFSEVWGSIKDGFLKAFSVAFYPVKKAGNIIQKLNLVNITLTGSPVNPNATFSATLKSASAYLSSEKTKEENNMTEEKTEPITEPQAEETPEVSETTEPEGEAQEVEQPEEAVPEVKSEPSEIEVIKVELTELKSEVSNLKEENAKLKAELTKPVMKAKVEEPPKIKSEGKYISPLDLAAGVI